MGASLSVSIDTSVWDRLHRRLLLQTEGGKASHVRVGVVGPEASAMHDGVSMVELAAIHEYGSPAASIPERSFIRRTFADSTVQDKLDKILPRLTERFIKGESMAKLLGVLGAWGVGQVKATIRAGLTPDIKEATKKRKGSTLPLVDTGRLINAITWLVSVGKGLE